MYTKNCYYKKNFFSSDSMIMVRFTKYKLKLIAKNRGIKDFRNMSQEQLLENLDKLERITEDLSNNRYTKIAKMQNL